VSQRAAGSDGLNDDRTPQLHIHQVLSFLLVVGLTIALFTVDLLSCPRCDARVAADFICEHCDQDGMVTLIRYFYVLGFSA
jgi:hypothetical protein